MTSRESHHRQGLSLAERLHRLNEMESRGKSSMSLFRTTLDDLPFNIFEYVANLGYNGWRPSGEYKSLKDVTASELKRSIDLSSIPDRVVRHFEINRKCPIEFRNDLPPQAHINKYPHNPSYLVSLYVAQERGTHLGDVDFLFGGSTLQMLATKCTSEKDYVATTFPGTEIVLLVKSDQYTRDLSDAPFQFERLLTGSELQDTHRDVTIKHLQMLKIGNHRVLFAAEVDGSDDNGDPVEVTLSNPRNWKTQKMFQMISNGSPTLYAGCKNHQRLFKVNAQTLSHVTDTALRDFDINELQDNILSGMKVLAEECKLGTFSDNSVWKLEFDCDGELHLHKFADNQNTLLPQKDVVSELLQLG